MRATAIVPIKRFDRAKSRLSGPAAAHRSALAKAMLADVLLGLREARLVDRILVVSGEPAAREVAAEAGAELLDDPVDAGHSEAVAIGVADAIAKDDECVALVPGDCPLLEAPELDRELDAQAARGRRDPRSSRHRHERADPHPSRRHLPGLRSRQPGPPPRARPGRRRAPAAGDDPLDGAGRRHRRGPQRASSPCCRWTPSSRRRHRRRWRNWTSALLERSRGDPPRRRAPRGWDRRSAR